ncbi:N-methyl-L-tryptophan oxidase [Microbacterium sp.]|uniref:N-methyl-L-tryptophan oxidase n=1 Tax=Microbacterium sp. TaxID=51671 RepID=UPI00289BC48F|nr:N-methyl-L-tryptophan oxidase [Microbacterium sp.]
MSAGEVIRIVDVAVVGAGSMGSMALWHLAKSTGLSVLGIEQYGPAHGHSAFAGESRLFRAANKEGALYTTAALEARALWTELERESGRQLLLKTGVLAVAPEGHPFLESTRRSIADGDLPHRFLDAAELRREYPQFAIEDGDAGVMDVLGGGLRSELAVATAQRAAIRRGAEILYNTPVLDIEESGDGVAIQTSAGIVHAQRVIITTGAWTTRIVPELRDLVSAIAIPLTWFMPEDVTQFTPDRFPCWMRDMDGEHAFGVPTLDGYSVKIAPTTDIEAIEDPAADLRELSREQLRECTAIATRMFPGILPEVVRSSIHPESTTADHVPILDVSESGRIVIGAGFSGNGFKFSPAYGRVLAELAESGSSPLQHPLFALDHHRRRARARADELVLADDYPVLQGH